MERTCTLVLCLSMGTALSFCSHPRPATCRGVAAVSMELDRRNLLLAGGAAGLLSFGGLRFSPRATQDRVRARRVRQLRALSARFRDLRIQPRHERRRLQRQEPRVRAARMSNSQGLSARTTRRPMAFRSTWHIIPDPSKKVRDDREDFGGARTTRNGCLAPDAPCENDRPLVWRGAAQHRRCETACVCFRGDDPEPHMPS